MLYSLISVIERLDFMRRTVRENFGEIKNPERILMWKL